MIFEDSLILWVAVVVVVVVWSRASRPNKVLHINFSGKSFLSCAVGKASESMVRLMFYVSHTAYRVCRQNRVIDIPRMRTHIAQDIFIIHFWYRRWRHWHNHHLAVRRHHQHRNIPFPIWMSRTNSYISYILMRCLVLVVLKFFVFASMIFPNQIGYFFQVKIQRCFLFFCRADLFKCVYLLCVRVNDSRITSYSIELSQIVDASPDKEKNWIFVHCRVLYTNIYDESPFPLWIGKHKSRTNNNIFIIIIVFMGAYTGVGRMHRVAHFTWRITFDSMPRTFRIHSLFECNLIRYGTSCECSTCIHRRIDEKNDAKMETRNQFRWARNFRWIERREMRRQIHCFTTVYRMIPYKVPGERKLCMTRII